MKEVESNRQPRNMKQWNNVKGENSWMLFKVISEFVDGFETLKGDTLRFLYLVLQGQSRGANTMRVQKKLLNESRMKDMVS